METSTRIPHFRDKNGRFKRGWALSQKGYPRYTTGQYRNQYVHRVKMSLILGRALKKDEDVHHKNGNKLDFSRRNLMVIDHTIHGFISARQHYFVTMILEEREKKWYQEFSLVPEKESKPCKESGLESGVDGVEA